MFSEARERFGEPLASLLADDGLDEAVAALRTFALIDRELITDERDASITTDCMRLHRLVRQVAQARPDDEECASIEWNLFKALRPVFQHTYKGPESWPRARRLDALVLALIDGLPSRAAYLLGKLPHEEEGQVVREYLGVLEVFAAYRYDVGAYTEARGLLERALLLFDKVFGLDDTLEIAWTVSQLARCLQAEGNLELARPLFERALGIMEKGVGPEQPDTALALNNVVQLLITHREFGELLIEQREFEAAYQLGLRALMISDKIFGSEHHETVKVLCHLASVLARRRDLKAARRIFERALNTLEKARGLEHLDLAIPLDNLALVLRDQGEIAAARQLHERALAITERVLGPDHPDVAVSLHNLGALLRRQGDRAGAQQLYERALTIREKALGTEHPATTCTRHELALSMYASGNFEEALACARTALTANDKKFGPSHPATKADAQITADVLDALGRSDEARAVRECYGLSRPPPLSRIWKRGLESFRRL